MNLSELSYDFIGVSILDIGLLLFIIYLVLKNETMDRKIVKGYYQSCILTIVVIICEIMTETLHTMGPEARYGLIIFNMLAFGLSTYIPMYLSKIFDFEHFSLIPWIPVFVYTVILLTTPLNGWMFSVDASNHYERGPLYFSYVLAYGWGFLIVLKSLLEHAKTLRQRNKKIVYLLMLFLVAGTAVQIINPKFHTSWTVVTFVIVIYYLFLCQMWFEYDVLTQVSNRSAFEKALLGIENKKSTTILMVDLDDFKSVNDTYGHQEGDNFLKQMAGILQQYFQTTGDCYRIGGDEFCVLLNKISEAEEETLLHGLEEKVQEAKERDSRITGMSWGIAHYDCKGQDKLAEIWRQADQNLYDNKKAKKARSLVPGRKV